jgi:hypothetical protein
MEQLTFFCVLAFILHDILFEKLVQISFQMKFTNRSTATNLLAKALLENVMKKSKKRGEEKKRLYSFENSKGE